MLLLDKRTWRGIGYCRVLQDIRDIRDDSRGLQRDELAHYTELSVLPL